MKRSSATPTSARVLAREIAGREDLDEHEGRQAEGIEAEHGGDVVYEAAPSGGAIFRMTLPVAGPALLPEAASAPLSTPLP